MPVQTAAAEVWMPMYECQSKNGQPVHTIVFVWSQFDGGKIDNRTILTSK